MHKMIIAGIGMFCAGVLLGGIGTGIAIAEYTSLEYTGEHILGQEDMKKEMLEISVIPEEGKKIRVEGYYGTFPVQFSEEIPMNTIQYEMTYNPTLVNLHLEYEEENPEVWSEEDEESPRYQGSVQLEYYYTGNEFDLFMKNKDKILNELKQGKVGSYQTKSVDSVVIRMNPGMKEYVEL